MSGLRKEDNERFERFREKAIAALYRRDPVAFVRAVGIEVTEWQAQMLRALARV